MPASARPPPEAKLRAKLGSASAVWTDILRAVGGVSGPLEMQWRPSKAGFGLICLVQSGKRTLLYLTPDQDKVWIAVILGERAYRIAMSSPLPGAIKRMFAEARPYAEGRGIRYSVDSLRDVPAIAKLVEIKTTPK
jgi:hypothetical protein